MSLELISIVRISSSNSSNFICVSSISKDWKNYTLPPRKFHPNCNFASKVKKVAIRPNIVY
jgi:hypothetical protein